MQHYAYGKMKWSDRPDRASQTNTTQSGVAIDDFAPEHDSQIPSNQSASEVLRNASQNRQSDSEPVSPGQLEDVLSRFL